MDNIVGMSIEVEETVSKVLKEIEGGELAMEPPLAPSTSTARPSYMFADMLKQLQMPNPSAGISIVPPIQLNGYPAFIFLEKEMAIAETNVKNTLVLKFPRGCPSLDSIKLHVVKCWGLS